MRLASRSCNPPATAGGSDLHHTVERCFMSHSGQTHWRVFCAVELPEALRSLVGERIKRLREAFPRVRASWERPEKIHITLKFLGDVEVSRVEELSQIGRAS